jgi:hypothetical protein
MAARRQAWSVQGGRNKSNRTRARKGLDGELLTLPEVSAALCRALRKVEAGELEAGVGNCMATIARAIVAVDQAGRLEDRVAELEARAGLGTG